MKKILPLTTQKIAFILTIAFVLFQIVGAYADEQKADESVETMQQAKPDHGWFWYDTEHEPKPEEPVKPAPEDPAKTPEKKAEAPKKQPMSVAWLRKMIPILEERAIDNPTRENLEAYMYAKRVMLDKAQRFEEEGMKVVATDPMLDENNRVPTASYAKAEFLNKEYMAKQGALKYLANNVGGLFVFFESTCNFCVVQVNTIRKLQKQFGFSVKYISVDGKGLPGMADTDWAKDNGHAKMLDLKVYPTTVLVVPPNNYYIVSQGMMALDQLEDRILTASDTNHLLPDNIQKNVNVWDRGVLTVDDMKDGARENPDDFVKYVKDKLKGRY